MTAPSRNALKDAVRRLAPVRRGPLACFFGVLPVLAAGACVPSGTAGPFDAGSGTSTPPTAPTSPVKPLQPVMTAVFEDTFERTPQLAAADDAGSAADAASPLALFDAAARDAGRADAGALADGGRTDAGALDAGALDAGALDAGALATLFDAGHRSPDLRHRDPSGLGPNWTSLSASAWRIENGKLCGEGAKNHGVWLNKVLPVNARIEFDATSDSTEGDLKTEVWGDGRSGATQDSYVNATSYLAILGGWKNTVHVLARLNEHGDNRKEIKVDATSDDPRAKPVIRGQTYRFKVERTDGKTIRWYVDGLEYLTWADSEPLVGPGHDHFGFNEWKVKVCFDNVKVTPLP